MAIEGLLVDAKIYSFFGLTDEGRLGYTDVSDIVYMKSVGHLMLRLVCCILS